MSYNEQNIRETVNAGFIPVAIRHLNHNSMDNDGLTYLLKIIRGILATDAEANAENHMDILLREGLLGALKVQESRSDASTDLMNEINRVMVMVVDSSPNPQEVK
jgi:triphosphoribosyl-dephospho-CoA synthetase